MKKVPPPIREILYKLLFKPLWTNQAAKFCKVTWTSKNLGKLKFYFWSVLSKFTSEYFSTEIKKGWSSVVRLVNWAIPNWNFWGFGGGPQKVFKKNLPKIKEKCHFPYLWNFLIYYMGKIVTNSITVIFTKWIHFTWKPRPDNSDIGWVPLWVRNYKQY